MTVNTISTSENVEFYLSKSITSSIVHTSNYYDCKAELCEFKEGFYGIVYA